MQRKTNPPQTCPSGHSLMLKIRLLLHYSGLQVPDDVTVLFSDDNWGNLMRVPEVISSISFLEIIGLISF
jgi:hypothetical protein